MDAPAPAARAVPLNDADRLLQQVASMLHALGALVAVVFGFASQSGEGRSLYLYAALALVAMGVFVATRAPRRTVIGATGFIAIGLISELLSRPDPTIIVPLFYLWPLIAIAYFLSVRATVAAFAWAAMSLAPELLIGATIDERVVYIGALSTIGLMTALVAGMRRHQEALHRQLEEGSLSDPLTGIMNRRAFAPAVAAMVGADATGRRETAVILLDLDRFKDYNDAHGHLAGDDALRRVAALLVAESGPDDLTARFGGEEFAVAMPGASAQQAVAFANRVAAALLAERVAPEHRVTASFGIATTADEAVADLYDLLGHADQALYAAKRGGRARAAAWTPEGVQVGRPVRTPAGSTALAAAPLPHPAAARTAVGGTPAESSVAGSGRLRRLGRMFGPADRRGAPRASVPTRTRPAARSVLIKRVAVAMFVAGAVNSATASAMLDMPARSLAWQCALAVVLLLSGLVFAARPGSLAMAQVSMLWGTVIVGAVVATCLPLLSAPLFLVWPLIVGAYFCSRKFVVWAIVWAALVLAIGLAISPADITKPLTWLGTILNAAGLSAVVSMMRLREAGLRRSLRAIADFDPLTGLLNRRAFNPSLVRGIEHAWRSGEALAVVLIDADHFKRFNDTHGHLAGDDALRRIAQAMRSEALHRGLVCRFGGEEFAVSLPGASIDDARAYVNRVARTLAELAPTPELAVTLSAGIAQPAAPRHSLTRAPDSMETLLARADRALYAAKSGGRNRAAWIAHEHADIVVASTEPGSDDDEVAVAAPIAA
jgi:diguanylate cyclase (GGDEF)-like protein